MDAQYINSQYYGVSSASTEGWGDITVYGIIIIGVIGIALFVIRQLLEYLLALMKFQ